MVTYNYMAEAFFGVFYIAGGVVRVFIGTTLQLALLLAVKRKLYDVFYHIGTKWSSKILLLTLVV